MVGMPGITLLTGTRFTADEMDYPSFCPPYSSLIDDAFAQCAQLKLRNAQERVALHPVRLQAGQVNMHGGELGRPMPPSPILIPEMTGGRIHTTNV